MPAQLFVGTRCRLDRRGCRSANTSTSQSSCCWRSHPFLHPGPGPRLPGCSTLSLMLAEHEWLFCYTVDQFGETNWLKMDKFWHFFPARFIFSQIGFLISSTLRLCTFLRQDEEMLLRSRNEQIEKNSRASFWWQCRATLPWSVSSYDNRTYQQ